MAVEIKLIFGAISFLLGLIWISGFNGLIADRFNQYNLRIASDSFFSNSEALKPTKFNNSGVDREIERNLIFSRDDFRVIIPRNSLDLNLRSYFGEKNFRDEDISSRNQRVEQVRFRNFDSDRRQHNTLVRRIESGRRERISENIQQRWERLPFATFEMMRLGDQNLYQDERRNIPLVRRQNQNSFRRVQSRIEMTEDRRSNRNGGTPQRRVMVRLIGNNFKNFFQNIWDWGSLINNVLAGISSYLFTIIAGLFIFDTVGHLLPIKHTEEKGFLNAFRNFASITGNVMTH